jgi:hypothetical protein
MSYMCHCYILEKIAFYMYTAHFGGNYTDTTLSISMQNKTNSVHGTFRGKLYRYNTINIHAEQTHYVYFRLTRRECEHGALITYILHVNEHKRT